MTDQALQKTRELVLDKARGLFLKQGYHHTSMRMIAKAAGVSTGPLYFHFQNKIDVFVAICLEGFERLYEAYQGEAEGEGTAVVRLRGLYRLHQKFYHEDHQYYEMIKLALNPISGIDLPADVKEVLLQKKMALLKIKEDLITEGIEAGEIRKVNPKKLSLYLDAVSEGIFLANDLEILARSGFEVDEMIDEAINLIGLSILES